MTGHVRERGKGNWYAVISTRDPAGSRKVRFISLPDAKGKREAKDHLARIVTEMQSGAYVEPDKVTVAQFLERWLNHIKTQVEPSTYERYFEYCTNNIIPALGPTRLTKLRPEQISDAYSRALEDGRRDGRNGGLAPRTVRHMHAILKQALAQACVWRAISNNPGSLGEAAKGNAQGNAHLRHRRYRQSDRGGARDTHIYSNPAWRFVWSAARRNLRLALALH
jgi:hypothetical protein